MTFPLIWASTVYTLKIFKNNVVRRFLCLTETSNRISYPLLIITQTLLVGALCVLVQLNLNLKLSMGSLFYLSQIVVPSKERVRSCDSVDRCHPTLSSFFWKHNSFGNLRWHRGNLINDLTGFVLVCRTKRPWRICAITSHNVIHTIRRLSVRSRRSHWRDNILFLRLSNRYFREWPKNFLTLLKKTRIVRKCLFRIKEWVPLHFTCRTVWTLYFISPLIALVDAPVIATFVFVAKVSFLG